MSKHCLFLSLIFVLKCKNLCLFSTGRSAPIYKVLSIDYSNALELVNKEYQRMTFYDLDLLEDLKVRLVSFKYLKLS